MALWARTLQYSPGVFRSDMPKTLLFPVHRGLVTLAAVFAREMKRRRGMESVALVHGSLDAANASSSGVFAEVIDLLQSWDIEHAEHRLGVNRARLAAFENEHSGLRVWPFIIQEARWRVHKYTYAEKLDYLAHSLEILESIFRRWDVAAVIGELTLPCYRIALQLCGPSRPYLVPAGARFFERLYFEDTPYIEWPSCIVRYRQFLREGVPRELASIAEPVVKGIREASYRPVYFDRGVAAAKANTGWHAQFRWPRWESYAKHAWAENVSDRGINPQGEHWARHLPHRKLARWMRSAGVERYYRKRALRALPNVSFAVFLPNVQPEYTIDVQGWPYLDQAALVRNIAQSLPVDMLLLVKEHRTFVPYRTKQFYERMTELPNVRLLDDEISSQIVAKASRLIFTITGTVALEALCLDRPVINFGRVFFNHLEGVTLVRDLYTLPDVVSSLLSTPVESHDSAVAAIAAMYASSYPGTLNVAELQSPHNCNLLGEALESELVRRKLIPEMEAGRPLSSLRPTPQHRLTSRG
jgi:hypothetical protein